MEGIRLAKRAITPKNIPLCQRAIPSNSAGNIKISGPPNSRVLEIVHGNCY
ncbi:hypothetical protein AXFE_13660 [Acidithrix ferrooxidans]|uniref:Uncharacterized protein n=1 Tax=Acidithrix ferrooxidans TaxID=1280514 RepID=A0A0D8HID4_9ACTN|nr:hypothetical protein AXFE_13660 [Acidithrix ferrooxidans]CAG4922505.1 unnamed protein product [Acidithrix sp. C25]